MKTKLTLLTTLLFTITILSAQTNQNTEKKVDYLEKIYFSGKNKEELNKQILVTIQEMQNLDSTHQTLAVTKQLVFLNGMQSPAQSANNSCDILGMLAAGMYNIDAVTAQNDGIPLPSDKAKVSADDAIKGLNTISSSANTASSAANSLAWSRYYLNGSTGGFGTANKLNAASNVIGGAANLANSANEVAGVAKMFSKDKACKGIPVKTIALGEHINAQMSTATTIPVNNSSIIEAKGTVLTIQNINFSQLSTLSAAIEKIEGVTKVTQGNFSNNVASLIVTHSLSLAQLLNSIISANKDFKMDVSSVDQNNNTGVLVLK